MSLINIKSWLMSLAAVFESSTTVHNDVSSANIALKYPFQGKQRQVSLKETASSMVTLSFNMAS